MKKTIYKVFSLIICFALLLSGCSGENSASGAVGDGAATRNAASAAPTQAGEGMTGKYIQQDVTPPQLAGSSIQSIRPMADGRILALGVADGQPPTACASTDGAVWETLFILEDTTFLDAYPEHNKDYAVSDNGVWWAVASSSNDGQPDEYAVSGGNHLFRVENGVAQELSISPFAREGAGFVVGMYMGGGTLLVETMVSQQIEWTLLDEASGAELYSFRSSGFYPVFSDYQGGKIYASGGGETLLHVFDAATGKEEATYPIGEMPLDLLVCGAVSGDGSFNYVDMDGIHKMALGGSYLQNVVAGRSFAFANSTFRRGQLLPAAGGVFWLLGVDGAGFNFKLYRYVFDENAPLVAVESLYIWTMEDNNFLKLAVSIYAQANPDCEVTVELGRTAGGGQTTGDIIRALNAQMLAGDVPDVLILDELPVQSMIRQGMLTDLSGTVNEEEYYQNILSAYKQYGVPYAYPALFRPVGMLQKPGGSDIDITGIKTLAGLQELLVRPEDVYLGGYSHLFDTLYSANSHRIFPGGESLDEAVLREFLAVGKAAVDAQGLANQEFCPLYGESGQYLLVDSNNGAIVMEPSLSYYSGGEAGRSSAAVGVLYDYGTTLIFGYSDSDPQPALAPVPGSAFIPRCVAGVPAGAANGQAGRRFVKTLLECQTVENTGTLLIPGFLVRAGVEKQHLVNRYRDSLLETDRPSFPNAENLDIEGLIGRLENAAVTDSVLREKVYEQAEMLYNGTIGLEEAVEGVAQGTELYFAERQ